MGELQQSRTYLTQKLRVLALVLYVAIVFGASRLLTGKWMPGTGGELLWIASALGFWCFTLISAPFFRPPKDSFVSSVSSALLLGTLDLNLVPALGYELNVFRWLSFGLALSTAAAALISITLYDRDLTDKPFAAVLSRIMYRASDRLGKGELVFTPPALISIVGFYQAAPMQMVGLLFLWVLLVTVKPIELLFQIVLDLRPSRREDTPIGVVGTLQRIDDPNIVRVVLAVEDTWRTEKVHTLYLPNERQVLVMPLFTQVRDQGVVGTGIMCGSSEVPKPPGCRPGQVYIGDDSVNGRTIVDQLSGLSGGAELIGFVVEESTISNVRFEMSNQRSLEEGLLVFCRQGDEIVYYQVLDATTAEESFEANPRGTHIVTAAQLGIRDEDRGFKKYGWLPAMNCPVFQPTEALCWGQATGTDELDMGVIPGSQITVRLSLKDTLEYHAAILGVTGTGKTELALDLVRHALRNETKVFCVDFTGEYLPRLEDQAPEILGLDEAQCAAFSEKLFAVETGNYGGASEKKELETFISQVRPAIVGQVESFLGRPGSGLGIFQLDDIANTRATLRTTELYLSSIFRWAREHRRARSILIVLEEAHTIVPEMNLYPYDKVDTAATVGRIGQIALQGRKYGVGILPISQRTALVSKTVLSQCNTCITFSLLDKTSLDYLGNFYTAEHVKVIPRLPFLQAVAFGKGIRSERPVVVQLKHDVQKVRAAERLTVRVTTATAGPS